MTKVFTIELHSYPQEFVIDAETEDEAIFKAKERFFNATNGASVYETIVTNVEEIEG